MSSLFISRSRDPFFNLAFENCLFSAAAESASDSAYLERSLSGASFSDALKLPLLYLWINRDVVVIGRFQNPWKECALDRMEADGVLLMRRDTGGGAVFHDEHNLCFTFIGPVAENYRRKNSEFLCAALKTLGIYAVPGGRNDITVDGMKISGAAFREKNGVYIHHGTLLVQTDLTRLADYLNPDEKKLSSKGIDSVRSRVTNLAAVRPGLTVEKVSGALADAFASENNSAGTVFENISPVFADESLFDAEPDFFAGKDFTAALRAEYDRLSGWDWRYGKSPSFTHLISERFAWGGIEIHLTVSGAKIIEAAIFSDALETDLVPLLRNIFDGAVYCRPDLRRAIETSAEKLLSSPEYPANVQLSCCLKDIAALF